MSDPIPTTYATIELRTERIADLLMALGTFGFQLQALPEGHQRAEFAIEDVEKEDSDVHG